jgi:hypothetical protein
MDGFRVIAKRVSISEVPVIVILTILKKGSTEYNKYDDNREEFGKNYLEPLYEEEKNEIESFVSTQLENIQIDQKEKLGNSLLNWLEPFHMDKGETLILESREWDTQFKQQKYKNTIHRYYDVLLKLGNFNYSDNEIGERVHSDYPIYRYKGTQGHGIYFSPLLLIENGNSFEQILFLLKAAEYPTPETDQEVLAEFDWLKKYSDGFLGSIDDVARYSERSYFAFLLADESLWRKVEESEAANPSLSAEELEILASVRHGVASKSVLPLFINGRAGSGKSTMLYHLFADYIFRKIKIEPEGKLIFLTYTDQLLEQSIQTVEKLLRSSAKFAIEKIPDDIGEYLVSYFSSFKRFLIQLLPEEVRLEHFNETNFVDFGQFKLNYAQYSRGVNNVPEDVAWHVIRTYIKGYRVEGYLKPEEYEELPNKEKSVPFDIYKTVYNGIWGRYKDSGHWDIQDLVRYVIKNQLAKPEYAVIFCDEAQDFTRIELDLILHLMIYRKYDLGWTPNQRLPFTLAGDPFQTLNPAGFRWEAVKAAFHDEICGTLDPENRKTVNFNFEELQYNYRSAASIVKLSNLLQFWRKQLFGATKIEPQKPWRIDTFFNPRLYVIGDTITEDGFKKISENSVIIIPCESGQELNYINTDPLLKEIAAQPNPPTFLSPMQAKGLEFPRVILYGFGKDCPDNFFTEGLPKDILLQNEFYLNKLYVGVTRATKNLIIIDTPAGKTKLWEKINHYNEEYGTEVKDWEPYVGGVTYGEDYEGIDSEHQDPIATARLLKTTPNPYHLREAASFFRRGGQERDAVLCEAEAFELENKFYEAGEKYLSVNKKDLAANCFWKGTHWQKLNEIYAGQKSANPFRLSVVNLFINQPGKAEDILNFLQGLNTELQRSTFVLDEFPVQKALKEAARKILKFQKDTTLFTRFASLLTEHPGVQVIIPYEDAALIFYFAKKYQDAVKIWEKNNSTSDKEYFIAKAEVTDNPNEKISWLNKSGDKEKIIEIATKTPVDRLNRETAKIIARTYADKEQFNEELETYWEHEMYQEALSAFDFNRKKMKDAKEIAKEYFKKSLELIEQKTFNSVHKFTLEWLKSVYKDLEPAEILEYANLYLKVLTRNNLWLDAIESIDTFKLKPTEVKKLNAKLVSSITSSIANNDKNFTFREKDKLIEFITSNFPAQNYSDWKSDIPYEYVGAAIERIGKEIDALKYYEDMIREHGSELDDYVKLRWCKVKQRHINLIEEKLKKDKESPYSNQRTIEEQEETLKQRKKELDEKLKKWDIIKSKLDDIPEYPIFDAQYEDVTTLKVNWKEPSCQIFNEEKRDNSNVMIDVESGQIMAFPRQILTFSEKKNDVIRFSVSNWHLDGELVPGKLLVLQVNDKFWKKFEL